MRATRVLAVVAIVLGLGLGGSADSSRARTTPASSRHRSGKEEARRGDEEILVRSGGWRGRAGEQGRWRARLVHARGDGSLSGEVSVDGSRLLTRALVEGRMRAGDVRGSLNDEDGRWIVRFDAKISGDSMSGHFETRDGDRGTWSSP